jgi:hypothetical protein
VEENQALAEENSAQLAEANPTQTADLDPAGFKNINIRTTGNVYLDIYNSRKI